jgi:small subunit ribosomal protein S9
MYGGGSTGQAEAVRMALARVMCEVNAENRLVLKRFIDKRSKNG